MTRAHGFVPCCVFVLAGCSIVRVCPPVQGSVVDAATAAPIKSAKVTIRYKASGFLQPDPERVIETDSQGRFSLVARHALFVWLPLPMDPVSGFSLQAKADGYSASEVMRYGPWMGLQPPARMPELLPPGTPKIVYNGEVIVVDPISLTPASGGGPAQQ